jgi:hypothetical protein
MVPLLLLLPIIQQPTSVAVACCSSPSASNPATVQSNPWQEERAWSLSPSASSPVPSLPRAIEGSNIPLSITASGGWFWSSSPLLCYDLQGILFSLDRDHLTSPRILLGHAYGASILSLRVLVCSSWPFVKLLVYCFLLLLHCHRHDG